MEYSFGNGTTERLLDLSGEDATAMLDGNQSADVHFRRLKAVIGFDLALLAGGD